MHSGTDADTKGTLYVVATPIGNLRDITLRALDVLKSASVIAAEDTRVTARLLHHHGIATRMTPLHEHNETRVTGPLLARLARGESVALVSDAGTPGISDAGTRLVAEARRAGYAVSPVPGASAVAAAVSVAGLPLRHFLFYGFLPARAAERCAELARLADLLFPVVFFEAPHRIAECAADLARVWGEGRRVVLARELTKLFEDIRGCTLGEAVEWLEAQADRRKGEFVIIVEGAARAAEHDVDFEHTLEVLLDELPLKQAVALTARLTGAQRKRVYALALERRASVAGREPGTAA
ncbi:MAG TPA: 16S rRNA (cytidine(1402)-2'-O)-methyltransferase [Burkholderiales bacterium]|nr:16S rRNA (cytidine(1402)-2'-O)-methyltransferase [Burkholderiales bacterium]